jgi:hypothetical protein
MIFLHFLINISFFSRIPAADFQSGQPAAGKFNADKNRLRGHAQRLK